MVAVAKYATQALDGEPGKYRGGETVSESESQGKKVDLEKFKKLCLRMRRGWSVGAMGLGLIRSVEKRKKVSDTDHFLSRFFSFFRIFLHRHGTFHPITVISSTSHLSKSI